MNVIINLPRSYSLFFQIEEASSYIKMCLIDRTSHASTKRKRSYACGQSGKLCSDRTPENKISVLRAYKGNDTFYAWKNGQNLISIFRRIRKRFTRETNLRKFFDSRAILISVTEISDDSEIIPFEALNVRLTIYFS